MKHSISRRHLVISACASSAYLTLSPFSRFASAQSGTATRLLMLGTQGGPNFNTNRKEVGSAILVDDQIYLVDCGYGVLGRLVDAGVNYLDIGQVFLTHLHDDHVADIPALVGHQWTQGRIDPTAISGPYGTKAMVESALAFNLANTQIRTVDEHRGIDPATLFSGRDVTATNTPVAVYEDSRVRVTCIENTHFPEEGKSQMLHRSVSYRFDTADRSIVFSGDTAYSENLVALAKGADILVCEAIHLAIFNEIFEEMLASGKYQDNADGILAHILGTHVSTEDAGRMAAEAGVKTLVMNHLIPGGLREIGDAPYAEGARQFFDGQIVISRDLMFI